MEAGAGGTVLLPGEVGTGYQVLFPSRSTRSDALESSPDGGPVWPGEEAGF